MLHFGHFIMSAIVFLLPLAMPPRGWYTGEQPVRVSVYSSRYALEVGVPVTFCEQIVNICEQWRTSCAS